MNANDLMNYLRGFAELVNEPPTRDQWAIIRAKVLETSPVETFVVDAPPMHNPLNLPMTKGCGCADKGVERQFKPNGNRGF